MRGCGDSLASFEFGEYLGEYVHGQVRSVDGSILESAQGFHQLVAVQCASFRQGFSGDHFRQAGAGGNGRHAAARLEADLINLTVGEFDCQLHNVAANGMFQASLGVRIGKFAHVARILEMVEDFF